MTMEGRLAQWRDYVLDKHKETGRGVHLRISHQYAPKEKVANIVAKERHAYDVAFLFHFLKDGLVGRADPALPFEHDFEDCYFPIAEYPRPIETGSPTQRLSLISNRRLRVQTKHADMSARLRSSGSGGSDYLISGQVEYAPWEGVVEALHSKAQWVACVDPFVDKQLLSKGDKEERKIVGFTSGLGAYGELNLTLSTEHDTLKQLTDTVSDRLSGLLPHSQLEHREVIATRVVNEAEEVIGLSSLRAVVGADERIREVIGFAAIRRLLQKPSGQMTQLIPLDSLSHWFAGSDVSKRPDLLQLTLEVRTDDVPLVHAELIECKFALNNPEHLAKACEQIEEGLSHLTSLLAPKRNDLGRIEFDRRYWWAQLHRAITSRSEVNLSKQDWRQLDHSLEQLAEGQYEIHWHSAIFTFWTNVSDPQHRIAPLPLPAGVIQKPFEVEDGYVTKHFQMGYQGIANVFLTENQAPLVRLDGPSISLKAQSKGAASRFAPSSTVETSNSEHRQDPSQVDQSLKPTQPPTVDQEHSPLHGKEKSDAVVPADELNVISQAPPKTEAVQPVDKTTNQVEEEPAKSTPEPSPVLESGFHVPEKILIGTKGNTDRPVYWHFGHPKLANRHLLIFGASGSGKTYGIQCLLAELAMERVRSVIIDYTDGFLPAQVEPEFSQASAPKDHFVVKDKLPLNPFRRQLQEIDPSIPAMEESAYQVATRVASIFASVFPDTGSQQIPSLIRVIQSGLEDDPNFNLAAVLDRLRNDSKQGESLANKLEPLIRAEPFTGEDDQAWGEMLGAGDNFVHILQLKALAREIQKIVTEFALWDLWDYVQNSGSKNRPIPVILDEIQNLNHGSDSPIDKMLREGRKFGLAMILATQTTSQFSREAQDRLFQAAHKLFFKPASTEIADFAKILADSTPGISREEWKQRLTKLEKGQCWSLGPVEQSSGTFKEEAVLVNVTSLGDRELGKKRC
ncbi:MAG: DUF87 domain-containing protein [Motiliproteus sp.]|nr:DUF87 domain-containing protein [Motiliproteus sp.]